MAAAEGFIYQPTAEGFIGSADFEDAAQRLDDAAPVGADGDEGLALLADGMPDFTGINDMDLSVAMVSYVQARKHLQGVKAAKGFVPAGQSDGPKGKGKGKKGQSSKSVPNKAMLNTDQSEVKHGALAMDSSCDHGRTSRCCFCRVCFLRTGPGR